MMGARPQPRGDIEGRGIHVVIVAEMFARHADVDVRTTEVVSLDPRIPSASVADTGTIEGDVLVLGVGAQPNFYHTPGAEEFALPLYRLEDAERVRTRSLELFRDAAARPDQVDEGALTFVIVGAGPTGVETAGAVAELVHDGSGVPFFIRTGKRLPATLTEFRLIFKRPPRLGLRLPGLHEPEPGVIRMAPSTGIRFRLQAHRSDAPGPEPITLDMEFTEEGGEGPTPYEVLLHARRRSHPYAPGAWGPAAADELVAGHGGWREPWLSS
ncbi:MAG TPA: FAD-dependent oxidoreductase [Kineosporiaceae bacterium]